MTPTVHVIIVGGTESATQLESALAAAGVSIAASIAQADVVFSASTSMLALSTARQALAEMPSHALYADLTPGTPSLKRSLADLFAPGAFVDAAVDTEGAAGLVLSASGTGARALADVLSPLVSVEVVSDVPGQVASRTLLRSMLSNGIASVLADTLWAAESLGQASWMHQQILHEFDSSTAESVQALLADTATNFKRRQMDMQDVVELLSESGYESTMLAPIQFNHGRIMHSKKIPHAKG